MSRTITTLALVSALAFFLLEPIQLTQGSCFGEAVKRPIKNVYGKASNIKGRVSNLFQRHSRYDSRSAVAARAAQPTITDEALRSMVRANGGGGGQAVSTTPVSTTTVFAVTPPDDRDFAAKCFIERGPNFKKPPAVHFYAYQRHVKATRTCGDADKLWLAPVDGDMDALKPKLNMTFFKERLFDTKLYEAKWPTYMVVHGFMANWNGNNWMCAIKDLVQDAGPANVFVVDWSGGSKPLLPIDYGASVSNTEFVGSLLGEFINVLDELAGVADAQKFHLIGHSLGAHICGFAGYYAHKLGRITGLDPAGPCFGTDKKVSQEDASDDGQLGRGRRRLSPESAELVVALHTDTTLFGLKENCAHYDVYVNGGYKQPKCAPLDPKARFADLLHLNFKEAFNLNIACSHSYSHKLINKFFGVMNYDNNQENGELLVASLTSGNKTLSEGDDLYQFESCYPVAYECASWRAFRAGECGFCRDGSSRCVYTGLSWTNYQPIKSLEENHYAAEETTSDEDEDAKDDDYDFNDEDEELNENESTRQKLTDDELTIPADKYSRGQHFLRSGASGTTCLYHYQIIIASLRGSSSSSSNEQPNGKERKHYYYLHLPLELSGRLTNDQGERLHDRLVQVSHKLRPNSDAYAQVNSIYLETLRESNPTALATSETDYEYYTALITFKQATPVDKCLGDQTNGAGREDKWHICKPLEGLQEARLWSSSGEQLETVSWVALNYMSGVDYEQRARKSYVMTVAPAARVQSRAEVAEKERAELSDLEAPEKSSGIFGRAISGADCLLSLFDTSDKAHAKRNFKCQRSDAELKFAIKLQPQKLLASST